MCLDHRWTKQNTGVNAHKKPKSSRVKFVKSSPWGLLFCKSPKLWLKAFKHEIPQNCYRHLSLNICVIILNIEFNFHFKITGLVKLFETRLIAFTVTHWLRCFSAVVDKRLMSTFSCSVVWMHMHTELKWRATYSEAVCIKHGLHTGLFPCARQCRKHCKILYLFCSGQFPHR